MEQLSKEFLSLKFDKELSSKLIQAESPVFNFKRIASTGEYGLTKYLVRPSYGLNLLITFLIHVVAMFDII